MSSESRPSVPWFWIVLILSLAAAGYYGSTIYQQHPKSTSTTPNKGPSVRVTIQPVQTGVMPINLSALGSVLPLNTVTVKTRVDGQIMMIYFQEGQQVNTGDRLAEIDPRPYQAQLDQAEGQTARDESTLEVAKLDLKRYHTLWSQDSIAKQTLDTQEGLVKQDEAVLLSDQAAVEAAKLNLTYCDIIAPISGRVGLRLVDNGNIVHATDTTGLVVITQVQPINVVFTLAEDSIPRVLEKIHASEKLPVEVTSRDRKTKLGEGLVASVDNEIDPTTGTLKFKAIFPNENNALFPNQFVNVRLLLETQKNVTLCPINAVQKGVQNNYVYLVKPDKTVTVRTVTVGSANSREVVITEGLVAGDNVVVDGIDKLQEGTHITPLPATGK